MGYYKDALEAKQVKAKKRSFKGGEVRKGNLTPNDWPELLELIQLVVTAGDGISISSTSDGGALCVTILNGPPPYVKFYASSVEDAEQKTEAILSGYPDERKALQGH
jgi:hypothetical protein